jgi:hypothetical protein
MLADRLVALTNAAVQEMKSMKDARPSQVAALREKLGDDILAELGGVLEGITVEQKAAAFDSLARDQVEAIRKEVKARISGDHCGDDGSDDQHYTWEDVRTLTLGKGIFEATNQFDKLLGS